MRWLQRVWSRTNLCPLWIESPFLSLLQPSCLAPGLRPMGAPPLENLLTIKRCEQKASAPVPGWTEQPHPPTQHGHPAQKEGTGASTSSDRWLHIPKLTGARG